MVQIKSAAAWVAQLWPCGGVLGRKSAKKRPHRARSIFLHEDRCVSGEIGLAYGRWVQHRRQIMMQTKSVAAWVGQLLHCGGFWGRKSAEKTASLCKMIFLHKTRCVSEEIADCMYSERGLPGINRTNNVMCVSWLFAGTVARS